MPWVTNPQQLSKGAESQGAELFLESSYKKHSQNKMKEARHNFLVIKSWFFMYQKLQQKTLP